ncbi:hypothetical protein TI04_02570 [Achromatium sp. WMS2]|nr:hypothetical protein TI04_02570 [Achromatium sp. WMS2]
MLTFNPNLSTTYAPSVWSKLAKILVATQILWILFVIAGCTGNGVKNPELPLTFTDSAAFDEELSAILSSGKNPVAVQVAFNSEALPPRMEQWFTAVSNSGGDVQMQEQLKVRGTYIARMVNFIFNFISGENPELYKPAQHYNVVLYKDDDTGQITKLEFKLRANVVGTN